MAPRALLLSPDDQAVNAITSVLQEMLVDCERPLDGATAAKKLNSQSYDLVLVDCENLPAAKLIFDVCRRANAGVTVPIAIVDGRAGLPTAFRLGAELILTKPVAKDQARTTIRTALSRLRKEDPSLAIKAPEPPVASPVAPSVVEEHREQPVESPKTMAAAAAATFSGPAEITKAISISAVPEEPVASVAAQPEVAATASFEGAVLSSAPAPALEPAPAAVTAPSDLVQPADTPTPTEATSKESSEAVVSEPTSDKIDLVALIKAEEPAKPVVEPTEFFAPKEPAKAELDTETHAAEASAPAIVETSAPLFSAYQPRAHKKKGHGAIVAAILVGLTGAGSYAAWMTVPGFRFVVNTQVAKAESALVKRWEAKHPILPPAALTPKPDPGVLPQSMPNVPPAQTATPASNTVAQLPTTNSAPATAVPATAVGATSIAAPTAAAPATNSTVAATAQKPPAQAALPGDKDTVILSSKGAEKRLIHRVEPTLPTDIRARKLEGTVVLKAVISSTGTVSDLRPVEGEAALADAATKAVKEWRYKPYARDGIPVPFQTVIILDFQQP